VEGLISNKGRISCARVAGLAAMTLFALWSVGPAQADAARCGGQKADVVGGGGDNKIKTDKHGPQVIVGGAGDDLIISKRNKDIICGGPGNDRIFSGTGRDKVFGEAGNDFIDEGPGSGKAFGAGGDDTIVGGGGGETMRGGVGNDRLFGEIQDDKMFGDLGDDLLVGGQGIDKMSGGGGNDWLRGDTNQDKYFGDAGDDTASFATATPPGPHPTRDGVDIDVGSGSARGDDSQESFHGIENIVGSLFEDRISGAGGGSVRGMGGGDDCDGFSTTDCPATVGTPPVAYVANPESPDPGVVVFGGAGGDTVTVNESAGGVTISGSVTPGPGCSAGGGGVVCARPAFEFGYVLLWGGEGNDNLTVGRLAVTTGVKGDGGPGDDVLNGGPASDTLFPGASGSDRLVGGAGDDALAGRPGGGDTLVGGPGNDNLATDDACAGHTYDGGGGGADVAGFAQAGEGAGVIARLGGTAVRQGAGACSATRIFGNLEVLEGTRNNDVLYGNGGFDLVLGREGNDVLDGRGGRDELRGDQGNDRCPDGNAIKLSC
jgi:Ca2+-binding RTX toxin-like protein